MLDRLNIPRHLSSRVWLLTLPAGLISFERRQNVPKLPIGALRFAGIPLIAAGLALGYWSWRNPHSRIQLAGPAERLSSQPATIAGLLVIAGAGVLLRSPVLVLYTLGLAAATSTDTLEVDEPRPRDLLGRRSDDDY